MFTDSYTSASFNNKNVGTGKLVSVSGISISGTDAGNYNLLNTTASITANITARDLTVTATGINKQYDGNADATVTLSDDRVSGDVFTDSYTTASFDNKNVGVGKLVSVSGISISGTDAGNYNLLSTTASTTADITQKPATWTTNNASKTFGDADPMPLTTGSGTGFLMADGVTATYTRDPGEPAGMYHITATLSASPGDLNNYLITNTGGTFTIDARMLTGTVTYVNHPTTGYAIPDTVITAAGATPLPTPGLSLSSGSYSISGFGTGSYTITPSKASYPVNVNNGIFADDASMISRHVVHLITLNANQIAAGKVSGGVTLTSFDAALIAQYIVGIPNLLNSSGTWRFTPDTPSLVVSANSVQDYSGILMGDVNGDWTNGTMQPVAERPADPDSSVMASVPDVSSTRGSAVTIPLSISRLRGIGVASYQFDIEYDPAVIEPGQLAAGISGTLSEGLSVVSNSPQPGLLKVVVYGALPVSGDGTYLDLRFNVVGAVGAASPLNISGFRLNDGKEPVFTSSGQLTVTRPRGPLIQGTVVTSAGRPVGNSRVTLTSTAGETQFVMTDESGHFEFGGVTVGETYSVNALSARFRFSPRTVSVIGGVTDIEMIAEP